MQYRSRSLVTRVLAASALTAAAVASAHPSHRVADIIARGTLRCGIWPHVLGFAVGERGHYSGFEVDLCRTIALAILGDADKTTFEELDTLAHFETREEIDIALRRLTWTPAREASSDTVFGPVTFYDGQGFLVPRARHIGTLSQLRGRRICTVNEDRYLATLHRWVDDHRGQVEIVVVENDAAAEQLLRTNRCDAYTADLSWLAAARVHFADGVTRYALLPDLISKEPLAPLLRAADTDLIRLVQWTMFALIDADELGVSRANLTHVTSKEAAAFLDLPIPSYAADRPAVTARQLIATMGSYGDLFDRNLGVDSVVKLDRGLNRPWNQGGLLYSPPLGP